MFLEFFFSATQRVSYIRLVKLTKLSVVMVNFCSPARDASQLSNDSSHRGSLVNGVCILDRCCGFGMMGEIGFDGSSHS
jgi:hypothetical protein